MDATLWLGIAVLVLGAAVGTFLMFGQNANPHAETAPTTGGTLSAREPDSPGNLSAASARPVPAGPTDRTGTESGDADVRIRWYQRIRSGLILLLVTVGIGTAVGAVVGAGALALNLMLT